MKPGKAQLVGRYLAHKWRPLHIFEVQASVTNRCNRKCPFCFCPKVESKELDAGAWIKAMAEFRSLGCIRWKFQGGEPTLRPDFSEMAAEAQRLGMITAVVTNGTIISEKPELLDHLNEVVVSLDSPHKETHDRLRGQDTYEAGVRALKLARDTGCRAFINMVANRQNIGELEDMRDFAKEMGVSFNAQPILFNRIYFDSDSRNIALSQEGIRSLFQTLGQWKNAGAPVLFSSDSYFAAAKWKDYDQSVVVSEEPSRCMAGKDFVHVEPNGELVPCSMQAGEFKGKNIITDRVAAALRHAREHHCQDCYMAYMNERKGLFRLRPQMVAAALFRP